MKTQQFISLRIVMFLAQVLEFFSRLLHKASFKLFLYVKNKVQPAEETKQTANRVADKILSEKPKSNIITPVNKIIIPGRR